MNRPYIGATGAEIGPEGSSDERHRSFQVERWEVGGSTCLTASVRPACRIDFAFPNPDRINPRSLPDENLLPVPTPGIQQCESSKRGHRPRVPFAHGNPGSGRSTWRCWRTADCSRAACTMSSISATPAITASSSSMRRPARTWATWSHPEAAGFDDPRGLIFRNPGQLFAVNQNVDQKISSGEILRYNARTGTPSAPSSPASDPKAPFAPRGMVLKDNVLYVANVQGAN